VYSAALGIKTLTDAATFDDRAPGDHHGSNAFTASMFAQELALDAYGKKEGERRGKFETLWREMKRCCSLRWKTVEHCGAVRGMSSKLSNSYRRCGDHHIGYENFAVRLRIRNADCILWERLWD
jgi:hypothetical protein